jgi:hypothetical protein
MAVQVPFFFWALLPLFRLARRHCLRQEWHHRFLLSRVGSLLAPLPSACSQGPWSRFRPVERDGKAIITLQRAPVDTVGTTEVCPRSHYSIIGGKRGARVRSGCPWTCRAPPLLTSWCLRVGVILESTARVRGRGAIHATGVPGSAQAISIPSIAHLPPARTSDMLQMPRRKCWASWPCEHPRWR